MLSNTRNNGQSFHCICIQASVDMLNLGLVFDKPKAVEAQVDEKAACNERLLKSSEGMPSASSVISPFRIAGIEYSVWLDLNLDPAASVFQKLRCCTKQSIDVIRCLCQMQVFKMQ